MYDPSNEDQEEKKLEKKKKDSLIAQFEFCNDVKILCKNVAKR